MDTQFFHFAAVHALVEHSSRDHRNTLIYKGGIPFAINNMIVLDCRDHCRRHRSVRPHASAV